MGLHRVKVLIDGRVQGVGYRMYVRDLACQYHVSGWVRNRIDGSVESTLEGETEMVNEVLEGLYARGSPIIRVDTVSVTPENPIGITGFEIRR
ncbi:MAG: acylphosphatase [Methanomicrobiales archaeon HGW-Methanomicrobiales-4]|nr:MAG: acylphosphatase [Methanomicrobiales archaeon HGW-Methanomicrobiales-4]